MTIENRNTIKKSALFLAIAAISGNLNAQVLEEVVVTATKRAESMQDVPIAVTAMDERAIQEAGITDIAGVALRTPGFSMGSYSAAQPLMYIRGIGSNERGAISLPVWPPWYPDQESTSPATMASWRRTTAGEGS